MPATRPSHGAYNEFMARILASRARGPGGSASQHRPLPFLLLAALAFLVSGCHLHPLVDTAPLDNAGMDYDAIKQLKALDITTPEVAQVTAARLGGFPDASCVESVQIFHGRGQAFDAGDAIAGLLRAGMQVDTILELARLNQLGLGSGDLQAMRLAGLSDAIILEVARRHAEGKPVLGGASLAGLKNAGLRESTLLELARRGVPDSQGDAILSFRRHGASDGDILRRFAGS
ncbi:MAG: hypothetical protein ABR973_13150 [Candidatus Acidiferrales bacterium]